MVYDIGFGIGDFSYAWIYGSDGILWVIYTLSLISINWPASFSADEKI
jgi:hypothetical protein